MKVQFVNNGEIQKIYSENCSILIDATLDELKWLDTIVIKGRYDELTYEDMSMKDNADMKLSGTIFQSSLEGKTWFYMITEVIRSREIKCTDGSLFHHTYRCVPITNVLLTNNNG